MSRAKNRVSDGTEKKLRNLVPFKPGQSGNPKGRPKGARNRLGTQFLEALEADFNQFGLQAIALVREKTWPGCPDGCGADRDPRDPKSDRGWSLGVLRCIGLEG